MIEIERGYVKEIRNSGGRYFGRIRESNGLLIAEDAGGRRIGEYQPNTNLCYSTSPFRVIGKGPELLGTLFTDFRQ